MTARLNLLLLVALVVSAVYLVRTSYHSRQLFVQLERERSQARQLELDAERLTLARRELAANGRVRQEAVTRLGMRSAGAGVMVEVDDPLLAHAATATQGAASVASSVASSVVATGGRP
ncbi:cell division protein FtsL [Leptothrix discophora]|uniref:Cell division protein FtsL n=1 Tax=Leptothrix discophora TaxID=89 RepID=A0ABT9FZS2_LEPDI|nr:cell division protein FtsL [Leptothrix discophora]MDP4299728.1 cell division protein FtsL [Leptothrix discophora]